MRLRRGVGTGDSGDTVAETFLALFLIVLAFFILLTSISKREEDRAKAVLGSLGSTFAERSQVVTGPLDYAFGSGVFWRSGSLGEAMRALFQSTFPLAEISPYQPFGQLAVEAPVDAFFVSGGSLFQAEQTRFLDRLSTILARDRPGLVFEAEITVFLPAEAARATGKSSPRALAIARAGAFARALVERGVPAPRVIAGIGEGPAGMLRLTFFERDRPAAPDAPRPPASAPAAPAKTKSDKTPSATLSLPGAGD